MEISCGVPQGSVLDPLFFLIYINNLCQISNIYDLTIRTYSFLILTLLLMNLVNSEMVKLSDGFKAFKLPLNIQKSNYIIFKPRQRRGELTLSIEVDGFKMNRVKEVNFSWCYSR